MEQIKEILDKGQYSVDDILRKGEAIFKEIYKGKELNEEALIQAIIKHPILLQRPIAVGSDFALILRDEESLIKFIAHS